MKTAFLCLLAITVLITPAAAGDSRISVLGEFAQRPGNPAVAPDGTIYFSNHPFDAPEFKVMKLVDGEGVPFPNEAISRSFSAVIGIQADAEGRVWILDMGSETASPKLVGWDTATGSLAAVHYIPLEASVENSFLQDFAIDETRRVAFIADMSRGDIIGESNPAIVAIDLETGETRRLLKGHAYLQPKAGSVMRAEGTPLTFTDGSGQSHPVELGLNPIAIDPANEWVYFSTLNPGPLYRVKAAVLGDFTKSESQIVEAIEVYGDKPSSDGIAVGRGGRVYITNVADNAISVMDEAGTRIWVQDRRLVWPDGLYIAPDDSVVVTVNQLNRAAPFNGGEPGAEKPYLIVRITGQ